MQPKDDLATQVEAAFGGKPLKKILSYCHRVRDVGSEGTPAAQVVAKIKELSALEVPEDWATQWLQEFGIVEIPLPPPQTPEPPPELGVPVSTVDTIAPSVLTPSIPVPPTSDAGPAPVPAQLLESSSAPLLVKVRKKPLVPRAQVKHVPMKDSASLTDQVEQLARQVFSQPPEKPKAVSRKTLPVAPAGEHDLFALRANEELSPYYRAFFYAYIALKFFWHSRVMSDDELAPCFGLSAPELDWHKQFVVLPECDGQWLAETLNRFDPHEREAVGYFYYIVHGTDISRPRIIKSMFDGHSGMFIDELERCSIEDRVEPRMVPEPHCFLDEPEKKFFRHFCSRCIDGNLDLSTTMFQLGMRSRMSVLQKMRAVYLPDPDTLERYQKHLENSGIRLNVWRFSAAVRLLSISRCQDPVLGRKQAAEVAGRGLEAYIKELKEYALDDPEAFLVTTAWFRLEKDAPDSDPVYQLLETQKKSKNDAAKSTAGVGKTPSIRGSKS